MIHSLTSRKRALTFCAALFLIGLLFLLFTNAWWPGIMLVIGIPFALRQFLLGRTYDTMVSLLVFVGTFITVQFAIEWKLLLPVLFTIGAIYLIFREFMEVTAETEAEREDDLNHEIEEKEKK